MQEHCSLPAPKPNRCNHNLPPTLPARLYIVLTGITYNGKEVENQPCDPQQYLDCKILKEIVINPASIAQIDAAIAINAKAVGNLFSGDKINDVKLNLDPVLVSCLSSGQYNLAVGYRSESVVKYYVALNDGSGAIPSSSNMNCAFQLMLK